jgi:hypothetical protein
MKYRYLEHLSLRNQAREGGVTQHLRVDGSRTRVNGSIRYRQGTTFARLEAAHEAELREPGLEMS